MTGSLSADIIELNSGQKYKGKVISEDKTSYLLEVYYTPTIKDEKRVAKDKVKQIIRDSRDAGAYKEVQNLVPAPDLLTEEEYQKQIDLCTSFLRNYPESKNVKKIRADRQILRDEMALVAKGGVKFDGKFRTADEVKIQSYDMDAQLVAKEFQQLAKSGDYVQALRKWEHVSRDFYYTHAYKDNLPALTEVLKGYNTKLKKLVNSYDSRIARRDAALEKLSDKDYSRAQKNQKAKNKRYAALVKKEREVIKTKWITVDPYSENALDSAYRRTESLLQRLDNYDTSKLKLAAPHFAGAWKALADNNFAEATTHVDTLISFKLAAKYTDTLMAEYKTAKEAQPKSKTTEEDSASE